MANLFTREAGKIWGELLHEAHNVMHAEQTKTGSVPVPVPVPVPAPTAPAAPSRIASVIAQLPKTTTTLSLLQAAFAVLGKCIVVAEDAKEAYDEGFVNIPLDKQEVADIVELVHAFEPIIDLLGHPTPTALPKPLPAAAGTPGAASPGAAQANG